MRTSIRLLLAAGLLAAWSMPAPAGAQGAPRLATSRPELRVRLHAFRDAQTKAVREDSLP